MKLLVILYDILLAAYRLGIFLASFRSSKARLWIAGRKGIFARIAGEIKNQERRIWIHCASLGEFEQGRPVIEALRQRFPGYRIVLTFFSPSGYEVRRDYEYADHIFYLPFDGKSNVSRFLDLVRPELVLFVKYELWYHYLKGLSDRQIPVFLISAVFRSKQFYFQWYGAFFHQMFSAFRFVFVQDTESLRVLSRILPPEKIILSGDTRYDRVMDISCQERSFSLIETWKSAHPIFIAGSTWPADEEILAVVLSELSPHWKFILAPHEINRERLQKLRTRFGASLSFYSELGSTSDAAFHSRVLVIDNIGMLASLYRYGDIAYVGGGFASSGIHNVLEPAGFGNPVIFGPHFGKFPEAVALIREGFAESINDGASCTTALHKLIGRLHKQPEFREKIKAYMQKQTGATETILKTIEQSAILRNGQ